jgi:hypothetical protein
MGRQPDTLSSARCFELVDLLVIEDPLNRDSESGGGCGRIDPQKGERSLGFIRDLPGAVFRQIEERHWRENGLNS